MFSYNYVKDINGPKLCSEIKAENFSQSTLSISTTGTDLIITFSAQLTAGEEVVLNSLVANHTTDMAPWQTIEATLQSVDDFVNKMTYEFIRENIEWGITQAGHTRAVGEMMRDITFWLNSKSLYAAMDEVDAVIAKINDTNNLDYYEISPFITETRLLNFKSKIATFLGA